jgi:GTPase SAR1 family protein
MGSANCCGSNAKSVKGKKLVMLGLDKSGKTTILYLVTKG